MRRTLKSIQTRVTRRGAKFLAKTTAQSWGFQFAFLAAVCHGAAEMLAGVVVAKLACYVVWCVQLVSEVRAN